MLQPPISEAHVIKIIDNRIRERTPWQNICYFTAHITNILQICIGVYIFGFLYQDVISERTYFRGGTTTCELYYDWNTHAARWLYFLFAFNILDWRISMNIGEKFLGGITIFSNAIAVLLNAILIVVTMIAFYPSCNVDNYLDSGNICQDRRACGIQSYIANVANNCAAKNPTGLPIFPTVAPSDLTADMTFQLIFGFMITVFVLGLVKTIASISISETTKILSSVYNYGKELSTGDFTSVKNIGNIFNKQPPKPIVKEQNLYNNLDFFTIYKNYHVIFYVAIEWFDYMFGLAIIVWFGWFQQNTGTTQYNYTVDLAHVGKSTFTVKPNLSNYWFYGFLALIMFFWMFNSKLATFFSNWMTIVGSICGFFTTLILILWSFFNFTIFCNRDGWGSNICNHKKAFCGLYYTNLANHCPNDFACPNPIEAGELTWDANYIILTIILCCALVFFLVTIIYSIVLQIQIQKYKVNPLESALKSSQFIDNELKENLGYIPRESDLNNQPFQNPYQPIYQSPYTPNYVQMPPQQYMPVPNYS
jgi:hypothetical protein